MRFRLDQRVIDNKEMLVELSLYNGSNKTLTDWCLTLDFPRFIFPETLSAGSVVQIGTYVEMRPEKGAQLAPNTEYKVRFKVKSAIFTNYECGSREAYISFAHDEYQQKTDVAVSRIELKMPEYEMVSKIQSAPADLALIPVPVSVINNNSRFPLSATTVIASNIETASGAAAWLLGELQARVMLQTSEHHAHANIVFVEYDQLTESGYRLDVCEQQVTISASGAAGFVHAVASLLQLVEQDEAGHYFIKTVEISDYAQYDYRGAMLDCARHFHSIETVKRLINQLARYKFNFFHWHLTDDEGWRIEISAFPELTEQGSLRGPGTKLVPQFSHLTQQYGGFYTKAQIREVVEYAQQRAITVIPEIDLPGHCRAAIMSLPELLIDPTDKSEYLSIQNYTDNVLSPAIPGTYEFIDRVLDEVCDMFPSPYIHIGADEVPKGVWTNSENCQQLMTEQGYSDPEELQGHILRYAENKLKSRGKRMLGWEEVKHGNKVSTDTVVYSWISEEAGLEAVKSGFDVVMQPNQYTYFDLKQDYGPEDVGVDWAGTLTLEQAYAYQPLREVAENDPARQHILGIQCALWSEVVLNQDKIDTMLFPRMLANAEASWSKPEARNWPDFKARLQAQRTYFEELGIKYKDF
ncbi:beta-N-acetylhexosaminidase [Reinekea sp.]|uniref:beta-N-acetylhexosaminidase n=1 Tax=Reinekea sp. TaxID=1970455 RepID=UPI003988E1F6